MNHIIINGDFLCRNLTGIERFAFEICTRLDAFVKKNAILILVPANAENVPDFRNIVVVHSQHSCRVFPVWEHVFFTAYVLRQGGIPLDFSNVTPLFRPGVVFIHDIYAKLFPEDFSTFRDRLVRLYACAMYHHAAKHARLLITVSEFSRRQLAETYGIPAERITVINNGWEHFRSVQTDNAVFTRFPCLKPGKYFFTLGSLSRRKNLKWIAMYAEKHPVDTFAVSGKAISGLIPEELATLQTLKNVVLVGYVSDVQVKALMERCRAFIFPSYYEGFGIPPLEALSCGVPVVVSRAASLPELYGNCVHYIDPYNADVCLDDILKQPVEPAEKLLKIYSYDRAARKLYSAIKNML
jgi:glycosyltransferase involved in cell wall biosynthesis